jgi:hypothetical protein
MPPQFAKVRLELGEHAEHVEECLPRSSAGIDRLLSSLQAGSIPRQSPCRFMGTFSHKRTIAPPKSWKLPSLPLVQTENKIA